MSKKFYHRFVSSQTCCKKKIQFFTVLLVQSGCQWIGQVKSIRRYQLCLVVGEVIFTFLLTWHFLDSKSYSRLQTANRNAKPNCSNHREVYGPDVFNFFFFFFGGGGAAFCFGTGITLLPVFSIYWALWRTLLTARGENKDEYDRVLFHTKTKQQTYKLALLKDLIFIACSLRSRHKHNFGVRVGLAKKRKEWVVVFSPSSWR